MIPTKSMLYRLLHDAFIEIRARRHSSSDNLVFLLADLFHNVPLQLDRLDDGEVTAEDILRELEEHAERDNITGWLELRIGEITKHH